MDPPNKFTVWCEKCQSKMNKFKTLKEEYYRCSRFPQCKIVADVKIVEKAFTNHVASERISADTVKLYRFNPGDLSTTEDDKVMIMIVKKEKGILSNIEEGFWR